jgi:hypothetical protein
VTDFTGGAKRGLKTLLCLSVAVILLFLRRHQISLTKEGRIMTRSPPKQKKPIFEKKFWERPPPKDQGSPNPEKVQQAVGWTLSQWELADGNLAHLFLTLIGIHRNTMSAVAVRRAYGSIESNSGRRNAVLAAGEVYFRKILGSHFSSPNAYRCRERRSVGREEARRCSSRHHAA